VRNLFVRRFRRRNNPTMPATTTTATAMIMAISVVLNAGMFMTFLPFFDLLLDLPLETIAALSTAAGCLH
jgi:hypothetical protein